MTRADIRGPKGVFVDHAGRLWVADSGNKRHYKAIFSCQTREIAESCDTIPLLAKEMERLPIRFPSARLRKLWGSIK